MMRTYRWVTAAVWALLGLGMAVRGGFTLSFLFYGFSLLCIYGYAARWVGLYGLRVERKVIGTDGLTPKDGTFTAGEEALVEVSLRRSIPLPIVWMVIRDRIGEAEHSFLHGPWLSTGYVYQYVLPLPDRGLFSFESGEIWVGDPFGIVQHRLCVRDGSDPIFVAPRPRVFGFETERLLALLGSARSAQSSRDLDERTDLRSYRDGDPIQRVVWKLAAKSDDWMIRTADKGRWASEAAVFVDTSHVTDPIAVDACAEAAAGVVVSLGSRGRAVRCFDTSGPSGAAAGNWRRQLASLRPGAEPSFADVARRAVPKGTDTIVLIVPVVSPEVIVLCREWTMERRNVIVISVRALSEDIGSSLAKTGVHVVELTADGERQQWEGGGSGGTNRLSFSS